MTGSLAVRTHASSLTEAAGSRAGLELAVRGLVAHQPVSARNHASPHDAAACQRADGVPRLLAAQQPCPRVHNGVGGLALGRSDGLRGPRLRPLLVTEGAVEVLVGDEWHRLEVDRSIA
jgi:hypothetical protein